MHLSRRAGECVMLCSFGARLDAKCVRIWEQNEFEPLRKRKTKKKHIMSVPLIRDSTMRCTCVTCKHCGWKPTEDSAARAFSCSVAGLARCTNVLTQLRKVQRPSLSNRCRTALPTGWYYYVPSQRKHEARLSTFVCTNNETSSDAQRSLADGR